MARIYTKTGDDGATSLLYGGRIPKSDDLVEAYGDIDEAVAALGLARAVCSDPKIAETLLQLQRELFVVAADLAANPRQRHRFVPGQTRVTAEMVAALERTIDELMDEHPLRPVFVVPGTTIAEAAIDLARTIVRRAERQAVRVTGTGRPVSEEALYYLNRLSDLPYVLARGAAGNAEEPLSHA
jgi:cob(I)alamin adenosyltransferase